MKRRTFIATSGTMAIAWPLVAPAQQPAIPVVGFLTLGSPEAMAPLLAAFHAGLRETGYVEGRNFAFAFRSALGDEARLPTLAAELVALKVAVIVASAGAPAAKDATATIPIVFATGDPVAARLVASLGRPGGNATGVSFLGDLAPKRLELLRELIPSARSVAFFFHPDSTWTLASAQAAARVTGHDLEVVGARTESEIDQTFARMAERRPDALLVEPNALFVNERARIVALAARHAIPAIYGWPLFVAAGGLVSYGPSLTDTFRLLGVYTGKILGGAKPADLPVQQPTKFELTINLRTAKALGLTVPPAILARADQVIE